MSSSILQSGDRRRYALVGTGGRSIFFYTALARDFRNTSQLVAFVDTNATRMAYANQKLQALGVAAVPTYHAQDFDLMVRETRPDEVIVTTIDRTHHTYVRFQKRL